MARALRILFPGAYYHVTCRGNDRKAIFSDDSDREAFLEKLRGPLAVYRVELHAYVLMSEQLRGSLAVYRVELHAYGGKARGKSLFLTFSPICLL